MDIKDSKDNMNVVAVVFSVLSVFLSWYTHQQLLPLSEAEIVLSESQIIFQKSDPCESLKIEGGCDIITPIFTNIGDAIAKDIYFKVYLINAPDEIFPFSDQFDSSQKAFEDNIINELSPGEKAKFGNIFSPHETKSTDGQKVSILGSREIIVFYLKYTDMLTNKVKEKHFLFIHTCGSNEISSLVGIDFNQNYELLKKYFEYFEDEYFLNLIIKIHNNNLVVKEKYSTNFALSNVLGD